MVVVKSALILSQNDSIPSPRRIPLIGHLIFVILIVIFL